MECRLILDPPDSGAWNMAVDQALLDRVGEAGRPVLRLYQWSQATLTLGYFQSHRQRRQHPESGGCPLLRRSTGGGAIIHDRELTYSLILPAAAVPTPTTQIYERVHRRVARRLQQDQLSATLHPALPAEMAVGQQPVPPMPVSEGGAGAGPESPPPFLCFLRRAVGDLVVWPVSTSGARALGHKVLGSAQRKGGGHILQHGSLLLERSPSAPQLLGINDFLPPERHWDASMVRAFFSEALAAEFGWTMVASELTDAEREVADRYHETRFSSDTWNLAR